MKIRFEIFFCLGVFLISCKKGKNNPESCNDKSTRRDVKIATDAQVDEIDTVSIIADIDSLVEMEVPCVKRGTERQEIEKKVFRITGVVEKVDSHWDGDWKVRLQTKKGNYINCEAPNSNCRFIPESRFLPEIMVSRQWIIDRQDELEGKTVTIIGVAFLDIDHIFPRKAAPNEFEIHPILHIQFQ